MTDVEARRLNENGGREPHRRRQVCDGWGGTGRHQFLPFSLTPLPGLFITSRTRAVGGSFRLLVCRGEDCEPDTERACRPQGWHARSLYGFAPARAYSAYLPVPLVFATPPPSATGVMRQSPSKIAPPSMTSEGVRMLPVTRAVLPNSIRPVAVMLPLTVP